MPREWRLGDFFPMAATRVDEPFDDAAWRFEPKFDGVRALAYVDAAGRVRLQSRIGRDISLRYPEVVAAVRETVHGPTVLDGEICALDERGVPDFLAVVSREHIADLRRVETDESPIRYYAFDLLALGEEAILGEALETRRAELLDCVAQGHDGIQVVDFLPSGGKRAFEGAVGVGYEGIVAKAAGSVYEPGVRSRHWLKIKKTHAGDFVVGAWWPGEGRLVGSFGALALGAHDERGSLRYVGGVGTGFTDKKRAEILRALQSRSRDGSPFADAIERGARFVEPTLVVEVEYMEATRDGRLRAPSFRRLRDDKPPADCLLVNELVRTRGAQRAV